MIKKLYNWRSRLNETIELRRRTPIQPGYHCGIFVCDCIQAMTGVDLATGYREHETMHESLDKMHDDGFTDMPAFFGHYLIEIPTVQASMGDVMLVPFDGPAGWAGGILIGERIAVVHPAGVGTVAREMATKAFRV